jgi:decaprenylphospho-beta-D-ribofuranose 2-oxidase
MSVTELSPRRARGPTERSLCGWGRVGATRARVVRPSDEREAAAAVAESASGGGRLIARGAGRSYGDAAQSDGGLVLDMTGLDRVLSIDMKRMTVTAQAGVTLATLMARLYEHGMTLPVVPGTRHVTLAGAIASDIHGKNHHRDGAFASHVESITLLSASGELLEVTPDADAELFFGTLGGMGLTGVILKATVCAELLAHPWVAEDMDRTSGLEQTLELIGGEEPRRYSVAWLDMLADGTRMGRGLVSRADPLPAEVTPPRPRRGEVPGGYAGALTRPALLDMPRRVPGGLLQPGLVRAFNAARWAAGPRRARERPLPMAPYFFPLDAIGGWNRLYGKAGLVQYQFVLPTGEVRALRRCFQLLRRLPVYLAVFKRFGPAYGGPLSFPMEGWTLAVDLPASAPGLSEELDRLDDLVLEGGGRVYLSKDIRLRSHHLGDMYPGLDSFRSLRARVDPAGTLRSDLGVRVGLCEATR